MGNSGTCRPHPLTWVCLSMALLAGCSRTREEVRIGVISMLSGEGAQPSSRDMGRAVRLAAEEVNRSGGLRIQGQRRVVVVLEEDDRSSPDAAVDAARSLINNGGVVALVGPQFSANAIPVALLADQLEVPMICPMSTHPDTTAGKRYVFRVPYVDTFQGAVLARFAYETLGARRAAVLLDASIAYCRTLAEVFDRTYRELGGEVVATQTYADSGITDFRPYLGPIADARPDLLFLPAYSHAAQLQASQAREVGLEAHLLGGDGWDGVLFAGRPEFEGAHYTSHWLPFSQGERSRDFVAAFRKAYGDTPTDVAATAYDAAGLLLAAIRRAASVDPRVVRDAVATIGPYEGVTGSISYPEGGDPVKSAVIVRIQGGTLEVARVVEPMGARP